MGKDTSNDGDDNLDPLRVLARALVPHLRDELGLDAGPRMATMMTADETPSPRATKEACRRGLVRGARKLHRRWTFEVSAWREFIEANGERPRPQTIPRQSTTNPEDAVIEELRRELGFVTPATKTTRRA
ncbi:MAG: hypothetical protein ACLQVI_19730 [Polyangiaceae bacterium]